MDRTVIRNAGLSLALCAGLGFGAMAAVTAFAAESTTTEDEAAATATAEDTEKDATAEETADDKAADTEAAAGEYADGEYTASGKGIGGDVPVTVTIKDGKIASVEVGDNSETQGIGSNAIEQLPDLIVEANGTDGVDGVSGATVTSNAIFTAVDDCLEQASAGDTAKADDAEATEGLADGTYEASGKGIGGDVPVTVTIKDGAIESVEVGDNSETQGIGSNAIEQLPEEFVGLKTADEVDGVDGVSGATVTSTALKDAVKDCLEQATTTTDEAADTEAAAGEYADGEYTASGKGIGGDVPVTVTIKDGKIASVEVGDNSETQGIGSNAIEQLPDLIVEANGTDGVDGVSGATVTSNAIFTAVDDCLEQASAGDTAKADDAEAADEETADKADADKGTDKASADKTSTTDKAAADEETEEK